MVLRRRLCQLILCGALLVNMSFLSAQTTWTAISAPTTQDLWSVCYYYRYAGTNVGYVAVGNSGTILTSGDCQVWTQRASGTTEWLVGVGFDSRSNFFVVVGDHGTILTSTDTVIELSLKNG